MLYEVRTKKSLEAVDVALRTAVEANKFGVIAVHDLARATREKGVDFHNACLIYEVCGI